MEQNNVICIAGKNNIAINIALHIMDNYENIKLIACCNQNDDCNNSFQRSFKKFCILKEIPIFPLKELYNIDNLIFLSLEFDKIIKPKKFLTSKLYNIHFSYLPEYKGMYTSALPIFNGEDYTGVTLHKIDAGIDTGNIIAQRKIEISPYSLTAQELYNKYISNGTSIIKDNLSEVLSGEVLSSEQSSNKSTYFSKSEIDYSNIIINLNQTSFQIACNINAFIFPAYQLPKVMDQKIYKVEILNSKSTEKSGFLIEDNFFYFILSTVDFDIKLYKERNTELLEIAKVGSLTKLDNFFVNNYDLRQRNTNGWDIAIIASYNGQEKLLNYLLDDLKWDVNTSNNNGTTLAMYVMTYCSTSNNIEFFTRFLNKNKPNLCVKDFFGKDIFEYAKEYKNTNIIQYLKSYRND